MNIFKIILCSVFFSFSSSSMSFEWWVGGDLHAASISEWKNGSYNNRLATSADLFLRIAKVLNNPLYVNLNTLGARDAENALKYYSSNLEKCVSRKVKTMAIDSTLAVKVAIDCFSEL
jgi:hypothetical protein